MTIDPWKGYTFDDVVLQPKKSPIPSRDLADLSTTVVPGVDLRIPIVSANMDTVTESEMMFRMADSGGLGILHRYLDVEDQAQEVRKAAGIMVANSVATPIAASVGVTGDWFYRATRLIKSGAGIICFDIAHGHSVLMEEALKRFKDSYPDIPVIAGNVATREAAKDLFLWGADTVKVGIGSGSVCTTRVMTGFGVPMLTAIDECNQAREELNEHAEHRGKHFIIADGGIRKAGDIVKALAAGADCVMLGKLLAGSKASPSKKVLVGDTICKRYRGMASTEAVVGANIKSEDKVVPEGIGHHVPYSGRLENVLKPLLGGVRSGISYGGAHNIRELQENATWLEVSHSGYVEGLPHAKMGGSFV